MPSPKKELLQKISSGKFTVTKKESKFVLKKASDLEDEFYYNEQHDEYINITETKKKFPTGLDGKLPTKIGTAW